MKARILLVDDEPHARQTYRRILESDGYEVSVASTGDEALELIDGNRPDVIVLDVRHSDDVASQFTTSHKNGPIPIVMITALNALPTGTGIAPAPWIRRLVYKPCRPKTLLEGIDDALRYHY